MTTLQIPITTSTAVSIASLKQRFCDSLPSGIVNEEACENAWRWVEQRYQESHRAYHTLTHITALLDLAHQYRHLIQDHAAVDLAILFHDIIYDPKSKTNEEDSAALFRELLAAHLPADICDKVDRYILETKKHAVSDSQDHDLKLFIDFDMSILGAEREEYAAYARQIRYEYEFVPMEDYCKGRAAVLRSFLADTTPVYEPAGTTVAVSSPLDTDSAAQESSSDGTAGTRKRSSDTSGSVRGGGGKGSYIFATKEFRAALEDRARENIAWECEVLSSGRLV
jgi:predicted metal-dependent HD superfamily phosphohydrolase